MREILFRGKSKHGKWYYGFYTEGYYLDGTPVAWIEVVDRKKKETDSPTVDPNTVGQYTGLTDKNGKKIFEGDVCRFYGTDGYSDYVVFWDDTVSQWTVRQIDLGEKDVLDGYFTECCEIIGNIHDNPELLGGVGDG